MGAILTDRLRIGPRTLLVWAIGLALIAGLVFHHRDAGLLEAVAVAGWWLPLLALTHLGSFCLDSLGWRAVVPAPRRVGLAALAISRWIGISVNSLLPVAQLGGEVVRARLLARQGLPGHVAAASVIVDITVGLLTLALYAGCGALLAASLLGGTDNLVQVGLGIGLFGALVCAFAALQTRGLFGPVAGALERLGQGAIWRRLTDNAAQLDRQVRSLYREWNRLLVCGCWRLLGWLWPCLELWLLLWLLGHPVSLAEAVVLEATGQALRSAGFAIPGGLGVQEGGVLLAASWLGVPTELALAAMLIRRARELAFGLAGLFVWSLLEGAPAVPAAARPVIDGPG
jgi:putative membrane protein